MHLTDRPEADDAAAHPRPPRHAAPPARGDAAPETIEASLQLAEAAPVDVGVPMGLVIASVHEKRDEYRKPLSAAGARERPRPTCRPRRA